jgi:hypothetical protein
MSRRVGLLVLGRMRAEFRQHHVAGEGRKRKENAIISTGNRPGGMQQRYLGSLLKHSHLCSASPLQRIIFSLMLRMNVKKEEIGNERRSLMSSLR